MPTGIYKHKSCSEETKRKISMANYGKKRTLKSRNKISKALMDRKLSKKHKQKLSENNAKFWLGKKRPSPSENTRKKLSKALEGKKSSNWKGGISNKYRKKIAPRPMPKDCEICGISGKNFKYGLCLDHNHKTGEFRGWLCPRCNAAIGMAKEDVKILLTMIDYITKNTEHIKII